MTSMPPRTLLYSLPALGIGSTQVESLRSYIERLSLAHHRTTRQLLSLLLHDAATDMSLRAPCWLTPSWSIYSGSSVNVELLDLLQKATGQSLGMTTLVRFAHTLSFYKLLNHSNSGHVRYCPLCFEEDLKAKKLPYGRLLWELRGVDCCITHGVRLHATSGCWSDNRKRLALQERPRAIGVCPDCGSIGRQCEKPVLAKAEASDIVIATCLANVLALSEQECASIDRESVREGVRGLVDHQFNGNSNAAADAAGVGRGTMCNWHKNDGTFNFASLAQLSIAGKVNLSRMLKGELVLAEGDVRPQELRKRLGRSYVRSTTTDVDMAQYLKEALEQDEAPTLNKVATSLGVSIPALRASAPALAKALVAKNQVAKEAHRGNAYLDAARTYMRTRQALVDSGKTVNQKNLQVHSGLSADLERQGPRYRALQAVIATPEKFELKY